MGKLKLKLMTLSKKSILGLAVIVGILGIVFYSSPTFANRFLFVTADATNAATTTLSFMTPGTATTTYNFDTNKDGDMGLDSAILNFQFSGSSTASQIRWRITTSSDGVDYYQYLEDVSANATSSNMASQEYALSFASTTELSAKLGNSTRMHRAMEIPTNDRYLRVEFYLPAGSLNGAVWAQIKGKRQINY